MNLELTGKLLVKYEAVKISDKFTKREFVVELSQEVTGNTYINYAAMQLVNTKCDIIDKYNVGDSIKVSFNIKGTKWVKDGKERYFSNLEAWRIEPATGNGSAPQQQSNQGFSNNQGNNNYSQGSQSSYQGAPQYSNTAQEQQDDLPF